MSLIYARMAQDSDVPAIEKILQSAVKFLQKSGSSQWQSGYPNQATIQQDLQNKNAYVLIADRKVAGYAAVIVGPDPHYQKIAGSWENTTDPYATIHRLALSQDYRGQHLASRFLSDLISIKYSQGIRNFRVDTYKKNLPMQGLATDYGFVKRGIVQVDDPIDPDRLAYELNLQLEL